MHSLPQGLQYEIAEGGDNFSQGQRQLFSLARALIRKSKILLLDEATSSIDWTTEKLIQNTIKTEFIDNNCTILIIAHRLDSIMGCDKVLVMSEGRVAEYDSPSVLLRRKDSLFTQLVRADEAE